uniref:Si:ch211-13k12.2 n=1 Tax=Takifugu rubripes TaxID=31033 RepID=A0A674MIW3_TAKRU
MTSLRQELHYRLYCGNNHRGRSGNRTLFHVKLTDSAIRTLEAHQNLKVPLSLCVRYIKIPAPTPDSPSALRVFTFYLSSDSKDQPQASFDCIHQYVSSDGREQLEGQGVIQDKLTVCATDDSYQLTRERMSQVEKDSWSHSAIEIKPGGTHQSKNRLGSLWCRSFSAPVRLKQITNNRRNGFMATVTHKPFRERIIHLLALKAYRKPELLLWMERERASPRDKAELGGILEEVAKVNPKDSSYMLRDHFYKLVQKDWPSYSEEEKMLIGRLLARWVSIPPDESPSFLSAPYRQHTLYSTLQYSVFICHRCSPALLSVRHALRTSHIFVLSFTGSENGLMSHNSHNAISPSLNSSLPSKTDFPQANALTGTQNGFPVILSSIPETHTRKQETKVPLQSDCMQQPLITILHKKKKSKKHKDKERARLTDGKGDGWLETSKLKQKYTKRDNIFTILILPCRMYSPVMSLGQRQSYKEDFCAEFDEYKDLHSRIATITHMFVKLGSKIKSLSPGTPEYKMMEDQILEQYNKYQKKFPGYREEKKRCEYLHEKLSYIKQLIVDYDVSHAPT